MKNRNPLNLSKKERIFVIATMILGVLVDNGSSKFLLYIMPIAPKTAVTWGILRVIGNVLIASVIAFIVFKMIRLFRQSGFTQKRILALIAWVVFISFIIVLNIWRNSAVQNFNQYLESTTAEIDKSTLSKLSQDLPPDKRSKLSFLHARSIFTHEGRIIEYPSPEGTPVTFTPTAEDQSNRNLTLFQQTQAASEKMIVTTNSLAWLIALLGAFGFGFTSTIQGNKEVN